MKAEYNNEGKIKCEVCGKVFNRVACHVNKVHGISALQYKELFGFKLSEGLCSEQSRIKTSRTSSQRYRTGKMNSFISNSNKFKPGECGRNRSNKFSKQVKQQ